jgi:hypothetical protein
LLRGRCQFLSGTGAVIFCATWVSRFARHAERK